MRIADQIARQFLKRATVVSKTELTENVFHLVITGQHLMNLNYIPGQHLRVFIGMGMDTALGNKVRTYSVWKYDGVKGIIELAICAHTDGPGSKWIQSLQPEEEIYLSAPKGKFVIDQSAEHYLFIGDSSALGHLYELCRNLSSGKTYKGIIYGENSKQLFPDLDGSRPFDFYELPPQRLNELISIVEKQLVGNTKETIVYIGGNGDICVELYQYFKKTKGWSSKNIRTKPFWILGKQGLE